VLSGETRLVGLIGNPVSESLSPRMQNAAFAARGLHWAYVPLPVEEGRLESAVAGLVALGFVGANVTAPSKTRVLGFCDEVEPFAMRAGSVNTLVVRQGVVIGSSTDGEAVVEAVEPEGARALVLGAGGAAQAVAAALIEAGVPSLSLAARNADSAHALAGRVRSVFHEAELLVLDAWPPDGEAADLVVNCTPVWDELVLRPRAEQAVVDLAYRPDGKPTALVQAAREASCRLVVEGLEVLARQGARSFTRWTGVEAPLELMLAAVRFRS
jgi:shikimate dehydrogenase